MPYLSIPFPLPPSLLPLTFHCFLNSLSLLQSSHPPSLPPSPLQQHDKLSLEKDKQLVDCCPTKVFKLDERENVVIARPSN